MKSPDKHASPTKPLICELIFLVIFSVGLGIDRALAPFLPFYICMFAATVVYIIVCVLEVRRRKCYSLRLFILWEAILFAFLLHNIYLLVRLTRLL